MSDKITKWLFFDVGTTLVDETKAYDHRIRDAISGTDITYEQFNEKRRYFAEQNMRGDIEAMNFFGLKRTPWHSEDEILYPDAAEILAHLYRKEYKLGVIANQPPGTEQRLGRYGIRGWFDVVVASAEAGIAKPDREIFLKALDIAGCSAGDAVMIGDRLDNDIYPAMDLGMSTVWIKQGFSVYQHLESSKKVPDHIIEGLSELKDIF
ncbi:MAG: HAD family hydrolase [Oscillospiraceae bacterium]|nr:HAD family hydrolase [Oscillospiraceae bacterium]